MARKLKSDFKRELEDIEIRVDKQIEKEFKEVEAWMVQRKKFLIKLGWVLGLITVLLILSHIYLRIKGVG